jgi:hypothetical protein
MTKIVVEENPYNNTWEVGWKSDDGEFAPYLCGYATREEAEAEIPGFDDRVKRDLEELEREQIAAEREEAERWPNLGRVRAKVRKLRDSGKAEDWAKSFDANQKLDELLSRGLHEYIEWPLPSWKKIKSGHIGFGYGR